MAELRWILLALGVLLVAGVFFWGRGYFRRSVGRLGTRRRHAEPRISSDDEPESDDVLFTRPGEPTKPIATAVEDVVEPTADEPAVEKDLPRQDPLPRIPEKVIALR